MDDVKDWLILNKTPRVGPKLFATVLSIFGTPSEFIRDKGWRSQKIKMPKAASQFLEAVDPELVTPDLIWLEQAQHHVITFCDERYPPLLKEIADPPPLLYAHGAPAVLQQVQLAIVGSRNPTPVGQDNTREFSFYLAQQGMVITSGLAIGIDGVSHQAALDAKGLTVAVMATGLNRVYPSRHHKLAHQIVESGGVLVSEFPLNTPPKPELFPRRNRIISGLSVGTLVVEAAIKSGSLITARQATEQGREVFAIPGSIHNSLAKGCHQLIKDGAKLVETAQDILEELGSMVIASQSYAQTSATEDDSAHEYGDVLTAISEETVPIDWLAERTGHTISELSSMLLMLELEGKIKTLPGGYYCRIHP